MYYSEEEGDGEEEEEEGEVETCAACGESGDLASCEECRSSYHPRCAKPRLRAVPRSAWTCQDCRDANSRAKGEKQDKYVTLKDKDSK